MHTENQAAILWCPLVRHSTDCDPSNNRHGSIKPDFQAGYWNACIASRCAMWRWGEEPTDRPRFVHAQNDTDERPRWVPETWSYVSDEDSIGWMEPQEEADTRRPLRRGYCGLVGKPEFV